MYGMSNTSPKLTFMAEGETVKERNMVLAYIMALHNEAKKQEKDDLPMDVSENPFILYNSFCPVIWYDFYTKQQGRNYCIV